MGIEEQIRRRDGLLMVDVQNDFCSGGKLPIKGGDEVVPVLNKWIQASLVKNIPIYASRDWHSVRHLSFKDEGGKWPVHCIEDTEGAAFHPELIMPEHMIKITKGVRFDKDQNSAFDETGLAFQLKKDGIERLFIGGLALDVCVLATVMDARKEGFKVKLILEATRAVTPEGGEEAVKRMKDAGVEII
jgi:nicotinamidase/pyrazinamidase